MILPIYVACSSAARLGAHYNAFRGLQQLVICAIQPSDTPALAHKKAVVHGQQMAAHYFSLDEIGRDIAHHIHYDEVRQYPREIHTVRRRDLLVGDFNQFLDGDRLWAVRIARKAAQHGVLVGIHSYDITAPDLHELAQLPNVVMAKNHPRLLQALVAYAKRHGRPWEKIAELAQAMASM